MKHIPWAALRRALTRFDRDKIHPAIAIRNTVGVVLPLIVAGLGGQRSLGLVGALGALNVAYSDGEDAIVPRTRRMLLASGFIALALFIGGLTGRHNYIAVAVAALSAFCAGMLVALGTAAADIGTVSLVTLVVFASRPLTPAQAALSGLVAFGCALLQTAISVLFQPVRGRTERARILAGVYQELSKLATSEFPRGTAPPATAAFTKAHDLFTDSREGPASERLRTLFSQAERIRLRVLAIGRVRRRLRRDAASADAARLLDSFLRACSSALASIGGALQSDQAVGEGAAFAREAENTLRELREPAWEGVSPFSAALVREAARQVDALAGQIRAATRLADSSDFTAPIPIALKNSVASPRRRVFGLLKTYTEVLAANLTIRSAVFRHALRLAVCVALGDAIGRGVDWQRSYWIPMTIAIVLKPDFISTYSRGILRLAGTFVGLTVATLLYHWLPASTLTDVIFVGAFTLMLRWVGPGNYGVFVVAVSGLVVALIANSGVAPMVVIPLRAMNTAIGGALALLSYALWPTWERVQFRESFARLLDSYRAYLRAVRETYAEASEEPDFVPVDRARQSARVARTNVEASVDRIAMEPGASPALLRLTAALLASSHDFIYAGMALEGATLDKTTLAGEAIETFLDRVDLTLYLLGTAFRHPFHRQPEPAHFPDMRAEHRKLIASIGDSPELSFLGLEADRMTNALNTVREQALEWLRSIKHSPVVTEHVAA